MSKTLVHVIEDEEDIAELLRYNLTKEGYSVQVSLNGEDGLKAARIERPNLILLDLMLPGMNGIQICKHLRSDSNLSETAIIMVTALGEEEQIIAGLEAGADDYVPKPFSPAVLIARISAVLRRKGSQPSSKVEFVDRSTIQIDPRRHEVRVENKAVELTATEFGVLHFLARHPGWVFTRAQIVEAVKGSGYPVTDRAVDVQIVGLRKKLGSAGDQIETVRGVGYRFKEPGDSA